MSKPENLNLHWEVVDRFEQPPHLNHYNMKDMDIDPIQSKKAKTLLLRQAVKEKAAIFFYHSIHIKNGVLVQDEEKRYALLEVK